MYSYIFIAVFNLNLLLLHVLSPKKIREYLLYLMLITMLFTAFVAENVFILNYTRISIIQAFVALCSMAFVFKNNSHFKNKNALYLYYLVCFYIGLSTRPTVILLFSPLVVVFLGTYLPFKKCLKQMLLLYFS